MKKIPYLLIVGDKEVKDLNVAVRKYGEGDLGALGLDEFIQQACEEVKSKKR